MRKTWRGCLGWMAAAVCLMMTAGATAETAFAWLSDTCGSLSGGYDGLSAQMDWIIEHADEENIRFAVHAGDIVCDWTDARQWRDAANVMGKLDGKVAYSLLAGYDRIGHQETKLKSRCFLEKLLLGMFRICLTASFACACDDASHACGFCR